MLPHRCIYSNDSSVKTFHMSNIEELVLEHPLSHGALTVVTCVLQLREHIVNIVYKTCRPRDLEPILTTSPKLIPWLCIQPSTTRDLLPFLGARGTVERRAVGDLAIRTAFWLSCSRAAARAPHVCVACIVSAGHLGFWAAGLEMLGEF